MALAMGAARPAEPGSKPKESGLPVPSASPAPPDNLPEYKIGSGDVLHIFVWKEPDLTQNATVRIDGRITVPLLGDMIVNGKTSAALGAEITTQLGRFVESPLVTVVVQQAVSARFFMLGEVKNPGPHPLAANLSIVQALALAGGFQQFAKKDEILLIRGSQATKVNYDKLQDGSDLGQNLILEAGDTVVVP
jgi:polysaccharide export outer membrane protein